MLILGIESSCDETSASIVERTSEGFHILSNEINSQIPLHSLYGGVVPEIASRAHAEAISPLVRLALDGAGISPRELDAVGVTNHPGLIGALLVGVSFAKGFAYSNSLPLIAVDHIKGHIAACYIEHPELKPPFLAIVASGGHTSIVAVRDYTVHETIGATRDDAAGETFDKVARVMGIPYPGGAEMDRLAALGDAAAYKFPSAAIAGDSLDLSFSGLKTAVINTLHKHEQRGESYSREDIAASVTDTIVRSIVKRADEALKQTGFGTLALAGGVAANSHLRRGLEALTQKRRISFVTPSRSLCGDNGAMIAVHAGFEYDNGSFAPLELNASAADY